VPGTQVGKYLLIECIGTGGAGMVYRALHTKLRTPVAVKFIRPDVLAADPDALERLSREAQLLAQLSHPNVVRVLDYEDDPARPFVVMEFVDGLSAADLIKQSGRVSPPRAVEIALQVLEGLDAARRLGVVHRDVKPANILLTRDGVSKLVDLGLAVVARTAGGKVASGGAAEGTVGYMAPEQVMGSAVDHRADQYSLGCTLYHLLTGRLPFSGRSAQEVLMQHMRVAAVHPHEVAPGVPLPVSRIVMTMMEKSPDDRYPDYAALRADLTEAFRE
jgi:serine/threonine protein kinase